jgi:hypothetical protein
MRRTIAVLLALAACGWCQPAAPQGGAHRSESRFTGRWWQEADPEERSGFINGAADCLTWTAHEKGFNATPEQLAGKISNFYAGHPERVNVAVVDAWKQAAVPAQPLSASADQGETWNNPHWYLNGDWWGSISPAEERGYLEGYLWCMNNRVVPKAETYSNGVTFYQEKIDAYIDTHPSSGSEAVAAILHRYRDPEATLRPR